MLVALDKEGNRIYANKGIKYKECFCPVCNETLTHRTGNERQHHFAHKSKTECKWDKDSKSPWHIRMQEIFPSETMEVRFRDKNTREIHIADIYIEEANTVIEFQHSPISREEFLARTEFHISEGRRIAWVLAK